MCTTKFFVTVLLLQRLEECAGGCGGQGGGGGGEGRGGERNGKYAFLAILAGFTLLSERANVFKLFLLEVNGDVYSMSRYTNLVYGLLRGPFRGP